MPMVLIDISGATAQIEGVITRRLLEVRPGVFVGHLTARSIEMLWDAIEDAKPSAALLAHAARTENGIALRTCGEHRYVVVDNYGLQLVATRKKPVDF